MWTQLGGLSVRMSLRIGSVVINCAEMDRMADFWTAALCLRPGQRTEGGDFQV